MITSWNKDLKLSDKHKANISKALKGRKAWNKGKKLSEEHRLKISQSRKLSTK